MTYTSVKYAVEKGIARITLNRPERKNALDDVLIFELTSAFQSVNRATDSRVVILTGAGDAFCSGMDLQYIRQYAEKTHEEGLQDAHNFLNLLQAMISLKKPIISAVNGPALGGGCGLVCASDFVYAARSKCRIGTPEVRRGFVPAIILLFLVKRMGEARAREFVLQGSIVDAPKAREVGLVTEVLEDDELQAGATSLANELASQTGPSAVSLTKELLSRMNDMSVKEFLEYASNVNALARKTDDFRKGLEAFQRKEKPQW